MTIQFNPLSSSFMMASLVLTTLITGVSCTKSDPSTLSFHSVYYDANGTLVSDATKSSELSDNYIYYQADTSEGMFLETPAAISETCLKDVYASDHPATGRPVLNFKFTPVCSEKFAKFTNDNIGKRIALLLNDKVVTSPRINAPISGGTGFIEGDFKSKDQVQEIVDKFDIK